MADNARIDTLVSTLLAHGDRHDQACWFGSMALTRDEFLEPSCGTTACAAGWARALFGRPGLLVIRTTGGIFEEARRLLGLTHGQASFIFIKTSWCRYPEETAIAALKHVKDHPRVTCPELAREFCPDPLAPGNARTRAR